MDLATITFTDGRPSAPLSDRSLKRLSFIVQYTAYQGRIEWLAAVEDSRQRCAIAYIFNEGNRGSTGIIAIYEGGQVRTPAITFSFSDSAHNRNHMVTELAEHFEKGLVELRKRKTTPHPFKVGDIIVGIWHYTAGIAKFYQVTAVPTPRKVVFTEIPTILHSGDWMNGSVMPIVPPAGTLAQGKCLEFTISMQKGKPSFARTSKSQSYELWDGEPAGISCD